jgi:integrase/recombinase XerD
VTQFKDYLATLGYAAGTITNLPIYIRAFMFYLENNTGMEEALTVRVETLLSYKTYLSERPNQRKSGNLSTSEQRHNIWAIRLFYRFMEQSRQIEVNPTHALKYPVLDPPERHPLSQSDIQTLYDNCQTETKRAILALFYGCGLRRSEAVHLNIRDIDFSQNYLYVRSGKGKKRRVIPLSNQTLKDLYTYTFGERMTLLLNGQIQKTTSFLLNQKGNPMRGNTLAKHVLDLKKVSKIKHLTCHSLRHAIATHLLENGLSIEQIRDFLGHEQLETTQIYTHLHSSNNWR